MLKLHTYLHAFVYIVHSHKLTTNAYNSVLLSAFSDPPQIVTTYQAQSAVDLKVTTVAVVGQTDQVNFIVSGSVALVSAFTGIDQPDAQWYFGNDIIVNGSDPRISILTTADPSDPLVTVSTLIITDLTSADAGIYESRASNNVREVVIGSVRLVGGGKLIVLAQIACACTGKSN